MKKEFLLKKCTSKYKEIVHSRNNKHVPFYRWYPFVEGFSCDFVNSVLKELDYSPHCCFDPFAGSGTTPLVCQENNLQCISSEINPFLFDVMQAKLRRDYKCREVDNLINILERNLSKHNGEWKYPKIETQTIFERSELKKWVLNKDTSWGIFDILEEIGRLDTPNKYKNLFKVALSSILLKTSNVFRNGKCLSYKRNWQQQNVSREEVHSNFLEVCKTVILEDVNSIKKPNTDNSKLCIKGDTRNLISNLKDNSIDLVITSPPYLNSRDYTDVYRLELWTLGYLHSFKQERRLRKNSIRAHVQVNWPDAKLLDIPRLKEAINKINKNPQELWNQNIEKMIKGYFVDLNIIMQALYKKLMKGARGYIVVGNSFYNNVSVETDLILAEMAKKLGYTIDEIRIGRYATTSGQQGCKKIRESVIVFSKE